MTTREHTPPRLFPALLKYWRSRRGLSQLDLASAANVSTRHLSYMETGRAQPSEEMILRLAATLDVPLAEQDHMLEASGFPRRFALAHADALADPNVRRVLDRMLDAHEPCPMIVMDSAYDILETNQAAARLLARFCVDPSALAPPVNSLLLLFDPRAARPFVEDWEQTARLLLSRLHREALHHPEDARLGELLELLLESPGVPDAWRQPDFSRGTEPVFVIRLRRDDLRLDFLTTITVFSAPQNTGIEEVRVETYHALDDATLEACARLARTPPGT